MQWEEGKSILKVVHVFHVLRPGLCLERIAAACGLIDGGPTLGPTRRALLAALPYVLLKVQLVLRQHTQLHLHSSSTGQIIQIGESVWCMVSTVCGVWWSHAQLCASLCRACVAPSRCRVQVLLRHRRVRKSKLDGGDSLALCWRAVQPPPWLSSSASSVFWVRSGQADRIPEAPPGPLADHPQRKRAHRQTAPRKVSHRGRAPRLWSTRLLNRHLLPSPPFQSDALSRKRLRGSPGHAWSPHASEYVTFVVQLLPWADQTASDAIHHHGMVSWGAHQVIHQVEHAARRPSSSHWAGL